MAAAITGGGTGLSAPAPAAAAPESGNEICRMDALTLADRIAVLRLGKMVAVKPVSELDTQIVVDLMTTGKSTREAPSGGDGGLAGAPRRNTRTRDEA